MTQEINTQSSAIIAFWNEAGPSQWFAKDEAFDAEIKQRFISTHALLMQEGQEKKWTENAHDILAAILVLDQFSRNMFRDTPLAFASDEKALSLALTALDKKFDQDLDSEISDLWLFFYLPFMHAEDIDMQKLCIELIKAKDNEMSLKFAQEHHDIIAEFKRFPHRNDILKRHNTPEEEVFMSDDNPRRNRF